MNDILSKILASISDAYAKSSKSRKQTEEFLSSPLADTLIRASGGNAPSVMRVHGQLIALGPGVRKAFGYPESAGRHGMYSPMLGMAVTGPDKGMRNQTGIHEMGHHRDYSTGHMLRSMFSPDKRFIVPSDVPSSPLESRARNRVDSYYRTNRREAYAQAFQQAVGFLRGNAAHPQLTREGYARMLAAREERFPGTGAVIEELLQEPVYSQHPARRFYVPPQP